MALSNWDTLAFDIDGPSHFGSVVNQHQVAVSLHKNWLSLTRLVRTITGPPWRREDRLTEEYVATVYEGELNIGSWSIHARRGPQDGIYVIAETPGLDQPALLVGCGVYGFTNPTEPYEALAVDLGVDPTSLMSSSLVGDDGEQRSVVGFRDRGDGPQLVTVAAGDVAEPEWVGVLPESVACLKGFVHEYIRTECGSEGWPGSALASIPWDESERCNQGDLYFEEALGVTQGTTPPGEADEPLLLQALGGRDG